MQPFPRALRGAAIFLGIASPLAARAADGAAPASIISGSPAQAVIESDFLGRTIPPCIYLDIATTRPARLLIMTSGLGATRIRPAAQGGCRATAPLPPQRLTADFRTPFQFRRFALLLDPGVSATGHAAEGEIVTVDRTGSRASVPLTLVTKQPSTLWTALGWFFGLLVPAMVTAALAYYVTRVKRQADEKEAFNAFRELEGQKISAACRELKAVFDAEHMENPGELSYQILNKHGLLAALPRTVRRKLTNFCRTNQVSAIRKSVQDKFPSCSAILSANSRRG